MTTTILKSSRGFTLMEVVITSLLISVVALLGVSAMLLMGKQNAYVQYSADMEENSRAVASLMPRYLGQAVDIDWVAGPIGNIGTNRGQLLRNFRSDMTLVDAAPIALGVYLREVGRPDAGLPTSELRATGLYFKQPTATTEGELIVASSPEGTGSYTLDSSLPTVRFGAIVDFRLTPGGYPSGDGEAVRVARLSVTYRKFLDGDKSRWRWCPPARTTGAAGPCAINVPYRDITRTINIPMVNNGIETDIANADGTMHRETIFGDLYFFQMGTQ